MEKKSKYFNQLIKPTNIHSNCITGIIKLNKNTFASCSGDGEIKIWIEINNKINLIQTLRDHENWIYKLLLLNDNHLLSCSLDRTINIYKRIGGNKFNLIKTLTSHTHWVYDLAKIKNYFISCSFDKSIKIWKQDDFTLIHSIDNAHKRAIFSLCTMKDEKRLCSGDEGGKLKIWKLDNHGKHKLIKQLDLHKYWINKIIELNDQYISTCSHDFTVKIIDMNKYEIIQIFKRDYPVMDILKLNEKYVISGGYDETIKLYNIDTMKCVDTIDHGNQVYRNGLCRMNKDKLITGDYSGNIRILSIDKKIIFDEIHERKISVKVVKEDILIRMKRLDKLIKKMDHKSEIINRINGG